MSNRDKHQRQLDYPMHIGLIGGIGPAATEFYYNRMAKAHDAVGAEMDVTIVHASVRELLRHVLADERQAQAEVFKGFVERLKASGAEMAAVTSLGGHFCIKELEAISPLPILNALPVLESYFKEHQIGRIGIMGTSAIMRSNLYGAVSAVEIVVPPGDQLQATHDNYVAMAFAAEASEAQRAFFFETGKTMCDAQGADAVLLAGTDLFLAFDGEDCGFPVLDGGQIHIDALVKASLGENF